MSDKINVFFRARVKTGQEETFREKAKQMMDIATEEDGCLAFIYHRVKKEPAQYLLYESWRDKSALDSHIAGLQDLFGPCEQDQMFPAKMLEFWEEWSAEICDIVTDL